MLFHPHNPEHPAFRRKVNFLYVIFCGLLGIVLFRLVYLQVIQYERWWRLSEKNRIRNETLYPERGYIYDRNGKIIGDNRPSFDLHIIPDECKERCLYAIQRLSSILGIDSSSLEVSYKEWIKIHSPFEPFLIKKDLPYESLIKVEVERLFIPGIYISQIPVRRYKHDFAFSHLLGHLGEISETELKILKGKYALGDIIGKTGIEAVAEDFLRGEKGWEQIEVDAFGRKVELLNIKRPVRGSGVYLTLDMELQEFAYSLLEGKSGVIIAMNPKNGEILAYAVNPSFRASDFVRGIEKAKWQEYLSDEKAPLFNRGSYALYPPGSTIKPFFAIAALEEKLINPNSKTNCPGFLWIGNRKFRCWKKEGHGWISLIDAIAASCDVYFYRVALLLGKERITKYLSLFGFGRETGIVLEERKGLIPLLQNNYTPGEIANVGIGQGHILVTPIQLLRAYAAIVNGGYLVRPRFIMKISEKDGAQFDPPSIEKLPIKESTLEIIKKALFEVVNGKMGTARWLKSPAIEMGGKTGTAQVVKLEKYKFYREEDLPEKYRDHALFVGFSPYKEPEIIVIAVIEHGGHGSTGAAPLVKKVIEKYYELKK
jgi:penicillin-binding protein 2